MELQEPAPRAAGRVLVIFLVDEEDAGGEVAAAQEPRSVAAAFQPHSAWPQDLVDFLVAEPDPLIERSQPAEPERKELGL